MRIVAILNQKGGVGKTTTAVNLGAALALRGRKVLLIDADPQGNLSDHLGVDPLEAPASVYDVLLGEATVDEATVATSTPGLGVVPSHPDLAAAEQELAGELGRELRLRKALRALPADRYDWVLIDCPPSLGLLSLNAMAAAGSVLITVQTEYFAMRGLGQLDRIVHMVREHVNPELEILGILPTLVNPVTKLAREVIQEVRAHYGERVFATRIRQNVRLAEAPGYQDHIFAYEPGSAGAEDYAALAAELEGDASSEDATPSRSIPAPRAMTTWEMTPSRTWRATAPWCPSRRRLPRTARSHLPQTARSHLPQTARSHLPQTARSLLPRTARSLLPQTARRRPWRPRPCAQRQPWPRSRAPSCYPPT
ncbi:MAG: ParA family protein [Planctomycetota bacterium]